MSTKFSSTITIRTLQGYHMSLMVSQITGNSTVCSAVGSCYHQRIYQLSTLLSLCEGDPLVTDDFPNKGTVMQKVFLLMTPWINLFLKVAHLVKQIEMKSDKHVMLNYLRHWLYFAYEAYFFLLNIIPGPITVLPMPRWLKSPGHSPGHLLGCFWPRWIGHIRTQHLVKFWDYQVPLLFKQNYIKLIIVVYNDISV